MRRILAGLLSDRQSVATGLVIGLVIWTITRLVDGVLGTGTIEYRVARFPTTLASGAPAEKMEVTLTNLSRATSVNGLEVLIADPRNATVFSGAAGDYDCSFEAPAWAGGARCEGFGDGMSFEAPMLIPGTRVKLGIKYRQSGAGAEPPIVRIRPKSEADFQLLEPGMRTFLARHELGLLASLLIVALVLFAVALAAPSAPPPS